MRFAPLHRLRATAVQCVLCGFLFLALGNHALAQVPDTGFDPNANGVVRTLAVQPDGKVLVGGNFSQIAGAARSGIARLRMDGQIDPAFAAIGLDGPVHAVAVQADGRIVIAGDFTQVNGQPRVRVARFHANGAPDAGFNVGTGPDGGVYALAVQPDGKIMIGGLFTTVDGAIRNRVARLRSDGSRDPFFANGSGANSIVFALAAQADGKVLLGGFFSSVNGNARAGVARLNADGAVDSSFDPGAGANGAVLAVAVQADSTVLLGGDFTSVAGTARNRVARLLPNGALDASFDPAGGADGGVYALVLQADGRVLIGGDFVNVAGVARTRIACLHANGALDDAFDPGSGANGSVLALALHSDGHALLGGNFNGVDATPRSAIARLHADGALDRGFLLETEAGVEALALQADGRILAGGYIRRIDGNIDYGVRRLQHDGSIDDSFALADVNQSTVYGLAVQADGKVLLAGDFLSVAGTPRVRIARLAADGTLDAGFDPGSGANGIVLALALQADGKVLLGGTFTQINGVPRKYVARLNGDGSLDGEFDPGTGPNSPVVTLAVMADGKVAIGGAFTAVAGNARPHVARLQANGALDGGFDPGSGADDIVTTLAAQPDGKLLLGGVFTHVGGVARGRVARVLADGSLDGSFDVGAGADGAVTSIVVQTDGKVLLSGPFTQFNFSSRTGVARLQADGTIDLEFNLGSSSWQANVNGLAVQADGQVLLGGNFRVVDGAPSNGIARLVMPEVATQHLSLDGTVAHWQRSGGAAELAQPPQLEISPSGAAGSWTALGTMQRSADAWKLALSGLPPAQIVFLRAGAPLAGGSRNGSNGRIEAIAQVYVTDRIFASGFE